MIETKDSGARRRRWLPLAATALAAGLLHGCGGGDGGGAAHGGGFTSGTAPTITSQPASQTVVAGSIATFTVVATGSPAPGYQWQISDDNGTTFDDITGATSSSVTTQGTIVGNSGQQFRVVVSNSVGTVTSNAASLTVTAIGS